MSNTTFNILLIATILMLGLALCVIQSTVFGILFIVIAYFVLPMIVELTEHKTN